MRRKLLIVASKRYGDYVKKIAESLSRMFLCCFWIMGLRSKAILYENTEIYSWMFLFNPLKQDKIE